MPTRISRTTAGSLTFGRNAVDQLPDVARGLAAKRLFVVTDAILAQRPRVSQAGRV